MFEEGHVYYGYVVLAGKNKFFLVVRNCPSHAYVALINTNPPRAPSRFDTKAFKSCFLPIAPSEVRPSGACGLAYQSWISLFSKEGRTLPALPHSTRNQYQHCGALSTHRFNQLRESIHSCDVLKEKHKRVLLGGKPC